MRGTTLVWICALGALATAGCQSATRRCPPSAEEVLDLGCRNGGVPLRLDRGDWAVSQRTEVSRVKEAREGRPPETIGYLVTRTYRQMRGGPAYELHTVTTLNRREEIGRIDQVGRTYRYAPRRNAGFEEVELGSNTLEIGVAKIFQTTKAITLEPTTERQLAFEALDRNGDGVLDAEEVAPHGDRLKRADRNRDGVVDAQEFDVLDVL